MIANERTFPMATEKKYIAKHLIPMATAPGKEGDKSKGIAPKAPTIKEIKPGTRIMLDPEADNTKFLLKAGALELAPADDDKSAAPTTAPKKAAAEKAAPAPEKKSEDMTVAELKAKLDEAEIVYEADAKKADLVALLDGDDAKNDLV